jgi:hypothetical protein
VSKQRECIDAELAEWMGRQHVFFVSTAPRSDDGHINISPKGGNAFRVLGPMEVVYHDYTGSGAETIAHLRENGRILVMFCAFEGNPRICRLHGRGAVVARTDARWAEFEKLFPNHPGSRAFIHIQVTRVATSCGFGLPLLDFRADREALSEWAAKQGPNGLAEYWARKNARSIDGLPAVAPAPSVQ